MRSRIAFFNEVASQVNVSFSLHTDQEPIQIYFNETKLQRIVDNNLSNAIKYTLKDEIISINISKENEDALLSFASKSTHIQDPEKVFNAYYREDMNVEGFGLGLNLVKEICEEENVHITLTSDKNNTQFTYTFLHIDSFKEAR
jgi:signal transduction histidine kinase